jgi:hypothetical protein
MIKYLAAAGETAFCVSPKMKKTRADSVLLTRYTVHVGASRARKGATMSIHPFTINIPQADLDDLRDRLARTRWSSTCKRSSAVSGD